MINMKIRLSVILFTFILILCSCSFTGSGCFLNNKNAMDDGADEIIEAMIVSTGDGSYIISTEFVFHGKKKAKSGPRGGNFGYYEPRISSHNLETGELTGRFTMGKREEGEIALLGEAGGKIWYVSVNTELGFHARDPKTLEILITEKQVNDANPEFNGQLLKREWNYISQDFRFDFVKKLPVVTMKSGKLYYIDPSTLKAIEAAEPDYLMSNSEVTTTSIELKTNYYIELKGQNSRVIEIDRKKAGDTEYLEGEFMLSTYPVYTPKDISSNSGQDEYAIITEDRSLLILSRSDPNDKAKVKISKIKIIDERSVDLIWQTEIDDIYYDPEKAIGGTFFETLNIFSKGNPNYKTMKAFLSGGNLIYIYNLKAVCIGLENGKILWQYEI